MQEREIDEMCSVHDELLAQAQALAADSKVRQHYWLYTINLYSCVIRLIVSTVQYSSNHNWCLKML